MAAVFASSGLRYAVTRTVASQLAVTPHKAPSTMRKAIACSITLSAIASTALIAGAEYIAANWINEPMAALPLQAYAICLPFISLSNVFAGYFAASKKIFLAVISQAFAQTLSFVMSVVLIRAGSGSLQSATVSLILASAIGECAGLLLSLIFYASIRNRTVILTPGGQPLAKNAGIIAVAAPIAASLYVRSALSTLQHMLVPIGLRASGLGADAALAAIGVIHGMAFPVVMFPSVMITCASELLTPELTAAQMQGRDTKVKNMIRRILYLCFLYSAACAVLLFFGSDAIGRIMFHSEDAGYYIRLLSPLVLVMYMDMTSDGLLRGLGEQLYAMYVNIADSLVSVILVWLTLPIWGIHAYLFMIIFTEIANFALSFGRLRRYMRKV